MIQTPLQQALEPGPHIDTIEPKASRLSVHPLLALIFLFVVLPIITRPVGIDVGTEIALLALYAVAFNLLLGYTGVVSFGHSLFFGIGAYGVGLMELHLIQSSSIALISVMGFAALAALLVGALIIKRRGVYFALLTLAFTQMMFTIAFRWSDVTGGESGLHGFIRYPIGPFEIEQADAFYVFAAIVSFCGISVLWLLINTPFGKTLQGIRENEKRMRLLGCNTPLYKLAAFIISAAFSGLAGGLQGLLFHSSFAQVFDWRFAGIVLMMSVLGGTGYFLGPVLGTLIYVFLQYYLSSITSHWMVILGLVFVFSIIFLPDGVASFYDKALKLFNREAPEEKLPTYNPSSDHPAIEGGSNKAASLEISGLSKKFGGIVVADDISVSINRGQLFSILGPNGAGKTTFFNMVSGLLPADGGRVVLNGIEIQQKTDFERARLGLSRSCQIVSIFNGLTVFENIRLAIQIHMNYGSRVWGNTNSLKEVGDKTWLILKQLGLQDLARVAAEQLSHGDQRLVELGITLASDPAVLLLDEPLAGLAEAERTLVATLIRGLAPNRTIVLVEHDVDRVLAISDHIAVLHRGQLIATGTPAYIASHPEVRRVYLGTEDKDALPHRGQGAEPGGVILSVEGLSVAYGKSQVLHEVSLNIHEGEMVGILGRNGVGKTTTVMSIVGALPSISGRIEFKGRDISKLSPDLINQSGLGIVPQGRRIFPNLTVSENLKVAAIPGKPGRWSEQHVFDIFPRLKERRDQKGRHLSGGEQQMLAIARALMGPVELLILDEPMEGLSPPMVALVAEAISRLREERLAILLVEQAANVALRLVDRTYILNNGQVVHHCSSEELLGDPTLAQALLGIHI